MPVLASIGDHLIIGGNSELSSGCARDGHEAPVSNVPPLHQLHGQDDRALPLLSSALGIWTAVFGPSSQQVAQVEATIAELQ